MGESLGQTHDGGLTVQRDLRTKLGLMVAASLASGLGAPAMASEQDGPVLLLGSTMAMSQEPFADSKTHGASLALKAFDQIELGMQQTVNYAGIADAEQIWDKEEIWQARTAGFANLDLPTARDGFVPFVGAFAGVDYDADNASAFLGPHAGFSQYLNQNIFLRLRYRYEWQMEDLESHDVSANADDGDHILSLGLGLSF